MRMTFEREEELLAEKNQMLWGPIINVREGQRDRSDQDDGRARYAPTRQLVLEYLESDRRRVWTAQTRAGMGVWLGWLGAALSLIPNGVLPCRPPETSEDLLQTGRDAERQRGHSDFFLRHADSPGYLSTTTGAVRTPLSVTPVSHISAQYSEA